MNAKNALWVVLALCGCAAADLETQQTAMAAFGAALSCEGVDLSTCAEGQTCSPTSCASCYYFNYKVANSLVTSLFGLSVH